MGDGTQICRGSDSWKKLITENIDWLLKQPRTLERDHIEVMLRESLITPPSDRAICTPNHSDQACPDCGAVDCNRACSSNQKCSSGFLPGGAKVCDRCGRLNCDGAKSIESSLAEAINHLFTLNDTVSIVSYDAPDGSKTLYRIEDEIGDYLTDGHDTWQAAVLATNLERTAR